MASWTPPTHRAVSVAGAIIGLAIGTPTFAKDAPKPMPVAITATSPIAIPDNIDGLARDEVKTANPLDLLYSYGNNDERVTLYIYRATNPNAALWFERADSVLAYVFKSRGLGAATTISQVTSEGASEANGLTRAYALSGAYKSTALAIVEVNRWMVKIRSTSKALDVPGQQARVAKAVAALAATGPVGKPHPLTLPETCPDADAEMSLGELITGEVIAKPKPEDMLMAGLVLSVHGSQVSGAPDSLAASPSNFCRAKLQDNTPFAALYRSKDNEAKGWTMLLADSGRSLSSVPLIALDENANGARAMLTIDALDQTSAVMLLKGIADPNIALEFGGQALSGGPAQGLVSVAYGTNNIAIASPPSN